MINIKRSKKLKIYIILLYLALYTFIYETYILKKYLQYADILTASTLIFITAISIKLLGFNHSKNTNSKFEIIIITMIILTIYLLVSFILGLKVGFLRNAYSLKLKNIINNILAPIIIIITSEILRYVIVSNNKYKEYKLIFIILTLILTLIDISNRVSLRMLNSNIRIFINLTKTIIPAIIKNMTLTYITYHTDYKPCILYRIIIDLSIYVSPIFPNISDLITSIINILLPTTLYIYVSRKINKINKDDIADRKDFMGIKDGIIICLVLLFIILQSKEFDYYIVSIATPSMQPNINVGDIILATKVDDDDQIKNNDVIAFIKDDKTIVHRVVTKTLNDSGEYVYITKGDANNSNDSNKLTLKNIEGKVIYVIPYLGLPSVWFFNIMNKKG